MHNRTYGATYDAVYEFLLENTGAIEGRIQERIKKWDLETMDDDVKKNIFVIFSEKNIYYKLDINPKNPALIQAVMITLQ